MGGDGGIAEVTGPGPIGFSARYGGAARVLLLFTLLASAGLGVGLNVLLWSAPASGVDGATDAQATWGLRTIGLLSLVGVVRVLAALRFDVRLDRDRLVRQGALGRRAVGLRTATFRLTHTTWLISSSPVRRREAVRVPVLVVRSSWWRRIVLPLHQRDGTLLPVAELNALAAAVERYATATNAGQVVASIRGINRDRFGPR
jgi:hypothetical protein